MPKYLGKCFGPSTRVPRFSTQMPWLFIIKICFTIKAWRKLIQSVVRVGILGMCHKFSSQGPALRILGLRVASLKSRRPSSRVLSVRVPVPGFWVPVLRVSSLRVSGSQVLILDYALARDFKIKSLSKLRKTDANY